MHAGAVGADVAGVNDDLDGGVLGGHLAQDCYGVVGRGVVDEKVFESVMGEAGSDGQEAAMELAYVEFLVVAGGHDGDQPGGRCSAA